MNRPLMTLCLAALCATQVGCVVDPCSDQGNGNDKVLFITSVPDTAQGLQTQAIVHRQNPGWWEGPFLLTRDPATCFNFDGAEVQVELPAAFGGEVATVREVFTDDWGPGSDKPNFSIEFKCTAPDGVPQAVAVRVVAGGEVRHEDSFNITCHALTAVQAFPTAGWRVIRPDLPYAVGGVVHVALQLQGRQGTTSSVFPGFGATSLDPMLVPDETEVKIHHMDTFRIVAPGQSPMLQVGSLQTALPITAIGADGWALTLESISNPNGGGSMKAWPKTPAGEPLNGMEICRWTASTGTRSEVLPDTVCDLDQVDTMPGTSERITELCVTALDRTTCAPLIR